jgi:hypothetical protein
MFLLIILFIARSLFLRSKNRERAMNKIIKLIKKERGEDGCLTLSIAYLLDLLKLRVYTFPLKVVGGNPIHDQLGDLELGE